MNVEQARAAIQNLETHNTPPAPDAGPPICSAPGSTELASYAYRWEWGETGYCSETYRQQLEQLARNLKRKIHFDRLATAPVTPMTRDERTKLKAQFLVAEEERDEAKKRAAELYEQNAKLAQQIQLLTVRERELKAQVKDALAERDEAERAAETAEMKWADQSEELQRLKLIADNAPDLGQVEAMRRELDDARRKASELERQAQAHQSQLQQRDRRIAEQNTELTALKKQG